MAQKIVTAERSSIAPHAVIPLVVAASVYLLLLLLGNRLLNDPDSYWHLAVGRWIVEHGTVPTVDPLSHTMRGAHSIAFESLSQLAYTALMPSVAGPGSLSWQRPLLQWRSAY